jgi:pimeloyl-ACP methyl ester carboxylesterase
MIGQLHHGTYKVGPAAGTCAGTAKTSKSKFPSKRVAIIGHSAGGFIVSSYPGKYHDVVAMVQANSPSGLFSKDPPGNAALESGNYPPPQGSMADQFGPIGDTSSDGAAPPPPEGYKNSFSTRRECEDFNFWRPGAVKAIATRACNPARFETTPSGEGDSFVAQAGENDKLIPKTGRIPILLAGADHDAVMPGKANALELSAWQEHCPKCDVSQFILKTTGHAFMFHKSMSTWTTKVVSWLRRRGIKGTAAKP